jgi:uncharacterized protein YbbC (DUF1343 family)/CubicO group peptidase (beta-lactamase class C family)
MRLRRVLPTAWLLLPAFLVLTPVARAAEPSAVGDPKPHVDKERLERIDGLIGEAVERGQLPGAVVLVVHRGQVVLRKAYGHRSREPEATPMTVDTLFDLASLTKPIATATSVHLLVEQGKLRLSDRVGLHLPEFSKNGKEQITVEQLLLHTSGLIADNPEADYRDGRTTALERVHALAPTAPPGSRFIYSDVGYIVLGELVERLAGMPLDVFARQHIFAPLGMADTGFRPEGSRKERAAPTEQREGRWMVGEVHDPRAYHLGGVAGHAGLFGTADDLAVYARMLLAGGQHNGRPFLSPFTVQAMTTPRAVPGGLRSFGWDVQTSFSANRGELFPRGEGFGHTGFTGTSIWIHPGSETAVIFLSNRVHPKGKGNVTRLRGQVATLVAAALAPMRNAEFGVRNEFRIPHSELRISAVLAGIDVLAREGFQRLKNRRVGLVTNHTGLDRDGRATIDLLHKAEGVTLVALFSPEHGIRGSADAKVPDGKDEKTGLPVYSLYGTRRKPTAETLQGLDTLVYDIQDAGCRFYTYISTLGLVLEAAAEHKLRVVVLDRPNPIGGQVVEGPVLDAGRESFVAYHRLPVRHGMTVGELAGLFNAERKLGAELEVVRMEGWRRGDFYDRTGLRWVNPSPNLRGLTAAFLYPGVGLLETTNVSVGRGTDRPFEWVGAPWLDGRRLAEALAAHRLPGVRFVPVGITPVASVHKGVACGGVNIIVDDWSRFQPLRTGMTLALELRRLYPNDWKPDRYDVLLGHKATWEAVKNGAAWEDLEKGWQAELKQFLERRQPHLLYAD